MRINRLAKKAPTVICRRAPSAHAMKPLLGTTATFLMGTCPSAARTVGRLLLEHLRKHARVTKRTDLKFNFRRLSYSSNK
jgi:hypothetical protein